MRTSHQYVCNPELTAHHFRRLPRIQPLQLPVMFGMIRSHETVKYYDSTAEQTVGGTSARRWNSRHRPYESHNRCSRRRVTAGAQITGADITNRNHRRQYRNCDNRKYFGNKHSARQTTNSLLIYEPTIQTKLPLLFPLRSRPVIHCNSRARRLHQTAWRWFHRQLPV